MELIPYSVERGVKRLLSAPRDLPESISWRDPAITNTEASIKYRRLFDEYVSSLRVVLPPAMEWWEGMIKAQMRRGLDEVRALEEVYSARLAGPASDPAVVNVVRKYWLECAALNEKNKNTSPVPPEVFLLSWLIDANHEAMVQILAGMLYWPIGLDSDGKWV